MPTFTYKATDTHNRISSGTLIAKDQKEVVEALAKQELLPVSITEEKKAVLVKGTVPPIELITFVRYLSTMLVSGISLSEGMALLEKETKHPLLKKIIGDVGYSLGQGQQLSTVFERYPKVFNRLFLALVHAGEVSGTLGETFTYVEDQLRADYALSSKIKGAMLYPGIVFSAMIGIAVLMFFFILPQIAKVFLSMKLPLPAFTQALFSISLFLSKYAFVIIGMMLVLVIILALFIKSGLGKRVILKLVSPVPVVKNVMRQADLARFTRIFSTLLRSGVPITEALEISFNSLTWEKYRVMGIEITKQISKGTSLSAAFRQNQVFPGILIQMIATGEKSGTLDKTLGDLASFYEEEVEESVKKATMLLEPILMLLVGIGVGGIILSIISPLYSVVGNLQNAR